jgi:hypothetical protein
VKRNRCGFLFLLLPFVVFLALVDVVVIVAIIVIVTVEDHDWERASLLFQLQRM